MSYELAPATTYCAACARPGMGPDCRARYGYPGPDVPEQVRTAVNQIALVQACDQIREHGFPRLADRILAGSFQVPK